MAARIVRHATGFKEVNQVPLWRTVIAEGGYAVFGGY